MDRHVGCDLETAKLILRDMAQLHAVPIALKLQQPEVFQENVKAYLACFHPEPPKADTSAFDQNLLDILSDQESCISLLPKIRKSLEYAHVLSKDFREPFATIVHRDMWVNNFMVKLDGRKVVNNRFVDFQTYSYNSPVRDLLFFLCTSVQFKDLRENFDDLVTFYYNHFVQTLEDFNCCLSDFSYENFMDEIKYYGGYEIAHILFMLVFIVCGKKGAPEAAVSPGLVPKEEILPEAKERAWWLIQEFHERKWMEF